MVAFSSYKNIMYKVNQNGVPQKRSYSPSDVHNFHTSFNQEVFDLLMKTNRCKIEYPEERF